MGFRRRAKAGRDHGDLNEESTEVEGVMLADLRHGIDMRLNFPKSPRSEDCVNLGLFTQECRRMPPCTEA